MSVWATLNTCFRDVQMLVALPAPATGCALVVVLVSVMQGTGVLCALGCALLVRCAHVHTCLHVGAMLWPWTTCCFTCGVVGVSV